MTQYIGHKEDAAVTDPAADATTIAALKGLLTLGAGGDAATIADGDDIALGSTDDPAASSTVAEDATARTGISLWKGIKNILILIRTALTDLTHTEDTQHTSGDKGVMLLGVRKDTAPSAIAGTDGDYIPAITDEFGNLWVSLGTKLDKDNDSILVYGNTVKDGSGTDYVILLVDGRVQVDAISLPVGTAAMAASTPVTIATDDTVLTRTKKTPVLLEKTVPASGTAVALAASETLIVQLCIMAKKAGGDNTGDVYFGISTVDKTTQQTIILDETTPGDYYELVAPPGIKFDLQDFYIDAANNDDGIVGFYIPA